MNIEKIREFVEKNPSLVTMRESLRYPGLFVVKYKNKVFYDNLWTPELQETRGLVVDKDWNVVAYPFTKIFNRGENGVDIDLDEQVIAVRKVNGFMGCLTMYNREPIFSTTGSLDSEYVDLVEKHLKDSSKSMLDDCTFIFEICDESDPHIIEENPGAYLIGCRNLVDNQMASETWLDLAAEILGVKRPTWIKTTFSEVVKMARIAPHEGYVVYGKDVTLKIKSPYYLVSKFLARKNPLKLVEMLDDPNTIKQTVDEEFYPLIDFLHDNKDSFISMNEQMKLSYIRNFLESQSDT